MFILGHTGIGYKISKKWADRNLIGWVFLGMVLPDLIDKPLYYSLSFYLQKRGADLGLISGSRTFGHTGLLVLSIYLIYLISKNRKVLMLVLGLVTHLFLDQVGDYGRFSYVTWPLTAFPIMPYDNARDHLLTFFRPYVLLGEILGAGILFHEFIYPKLKAPNNKRL